MKTMLLTIAVLFTPAPCQPAEAASTTRFAVSKDGTRIAYEVAGTGPVVLLLHGGGQTRHVWREAGYISRMASDFTVVAIDLRGNGDSDRPADASAYRIDRLVEDILAVADAVAAPRFALWGFSYGANIGRYVAARTERVSAMVYIGIPFGPAADARFRKAIDDMRAKWTPIIAAHSAGRLDTTSLPEPDRRAWERGNMPVTIAWLTALLDYPAVEPSAMRCPTLWLVGTENAGAMASVKAYEGKLAGTRVTLHLLDGANHPQELERIDDTLSLARRFTLMHR